MTGIRWNTVSRRPTVTVSAMKSTAISFQQHLSGLKAATFCCLNTHTHTHTHVPIPFELTLVHMNMG